MSQVTTPRYTPLVSNPPSLSAKDKSIRQRDVLDPSCYEILRKKRQLSVGVQRWTW